MQFVFIYITFKADANASNVFIQHLIFLLDKILDGISNVGWNLIFSFAHFHKTCFIQSDWMRWERDLQWLYAIWQQGNLSNLRAFNTESRWMQYHILSQVAVKLLLNEWHRVFFYQMIYTLLHTTKIQENVTKNNMKKHQTTQ